ARTSWVLSARILLATGEYTRALACFDGYLGGGATGPLAPEAMAGRASALEGLGRGEAAREQWRALLKRFPRSSASARARSRLAEEGSP
ncbi:MAG: tetratricopeptide repeat protein, partial [Myxococcota bacterium]